MPPTIPVDLNQLIAQFPKYQDPSRIRTDVLDVWRHRQSLVPTRGKWTLSTGQECELLMLEGTFSIVYRAVEYFTPVEVYITENYPTSPPMCYIRPTAGMSLKVGHKHVDQSGLVYLPYLQEWTARTHNLVELIANMSSVFGAEPALFATPPGGRPQSSPQQLHRQQCQPVYPGAGVGAGAVPSPYTPYQSKSTPAPGPMPEQVRKQKEEQYRIGSTTTKGMGPVGLVQGALAPLRRACDAIDAIQGATKLDASLYGGYYSAIEPLKNKPEVIATIGIERELRLLTDLFTRVADLIGEYTVARGDGRITKHLFEELERIDPEVMSNLANMVAKGAIGPEALVLQHRRKTKDRLTRPLKEMRPPSLPDMAAVPAGALALPRSYVGRSGVQEIVDGLTNPDNALAPYTVVGMGGSGKSMLASAVVREESVREHFRGGIFWIRAGRAAKNSLLPILQGLARDIGAAPTDAPHGVPHVLDNLEKVKQHLTAVGSASTSPRLVVLDDVWEREVVDALLSVGYKVLVTTRDRSVVGVPGGWLELGNMPEDEALELLWRTSMTVGQPEKNVQTQMAKVAALCGRMPLALAIAGSMSVVTGKGSNAAAWEELVKEFENGAEKMRARGQQSSSIQWVLETSFDALSTRSQEEMLKMAVLAAGAIAPIDMLLNLWETQDVDGTREDADGLVSKSLLQDVGDGHRVHDLVLEFVKIKIKANATLTEKATRLQAQHLRRLDVVEGYGDQEHGAGNQGLFALDALWRSVEKLSGDPGLEVASYRTSLGELESCDAIEDVATSYWSVGHLFHLQGKYAEAEPLYERCQAIREKALGPEHPDVAITLTGRAGLLEKQGKYAEADPLYLRAIEIGEETVGPEHPDVATTLNGRAGLLEKQGKYAEAETLYEQCQAMLEKVLGPEHPCVATTLNGRAGLLEKQGKYAEAEALYERCQAMLEKVRGPEHPDVATTLNGRAELLEEQGKYAEAEALYDRCQAIKEKALGPEHPDVATILNGRAGLLQKQGKYAEAEPLYERCQAIRENALGPGHPDVATTLNGRAGLLEKQGKYIEAEALYERCQAIREKALGPGHPDVATTLNGRAGLLEKQGKYAEAEALYDRCQAIREKALGPEHPDVATILNGRAGLLQKQGKYAEAEPLYERCQAIRENALGPGHPDVATTLNGRAGLLEKQGKFNEAEPLYRRALTISEKALGPDHPIVATTLNKWAGLLENQGKHTEAEPLYRRSLAIHKQIFGPYHPAVADSFDDLAAVLVAQGNYGEAEVLYEQSTSVRERLLGPEHPDVARTLTRMAFLLDFQGKHTEAEPLYRRSLAIYKQIFGPYHPAVVDSFDDLAGVLVAQGNYGEAEVLYEQSTSVRERSLGPEHPDVARTLTRMAVLLDFQGKYVEAERFYERSLAILEISLGPAHPSVATIFNNLAVVQFRQGKYDEAAHQCSQALAIWEPIGGEFSTNIVMGLTNLAIVREMQGAYDDAIALYKKALEVAVATLGENDPQSVSLSKRLAEAVEKYQVSDDAAATAKPESKLDSPSGDGGFKGPTTTAKPESNLVSPSEAGVPDSSTTATSKWKLGHPSEYGLQGRAQLLPEISGHSELHLAAQHGNIELVEVLLVRPVRPMDPDVRGKGETPLHVAVYHRHEDIVRMLLRHGADANLRNSSGRTPLHIACPHQSPHAMVAMLLDWGADPRIRDHQGQVPLTHAGPDPGPELERMLAPAEESDCKKTIILAQSLGCDAKVFSSVTFGVELELEDGTLDAEVPETVTIASEVRIVQCSNERDTSRTHEELAARAAESCMTDPGPNVFVAMPFIHGPSSVKFNDECPARLRFLVGFVDDFEDVDDEEDGADKATSDGFKTRLLRKYEPLVSPDGVFWTMQMPFEIITRPQLGLPTEVWLETKIYHFSTFALADVNPGFKDPGSDLLTDWYVLGDVPRRLPPWRRSGWSRKKPSIFLLGNATTSQDYIFFYIIKNNDITAAAQSDGKNANLTLPWGGAGGGKDRSRQETMTSRGTNNIYKWDVPKGRYFPADPIVDGRFVHQAVTVVVGFLEENQASPPSNTSNMVFAVLDMKPLQVNKMFVVTEARIEAWKKFRGDTLQSNKERDVLAFVRAQNLSSSAAPSHGPSGSATLTSP